MSVSFQVIFLDISRLTLQALLQTAGKRSQETRLPEDPVAVRRLLYLSAARTPGVPCVADPGSLVSGCTFRTMSSVGVMSPAAAPATDYYEEEDLESAEEEDDRSFRGRESDEGERCCRLCLHSAPTTCQRCGEVTSWTDSLLSCVGSPSDQAAVFSSPTLSDGGEGVPARLILYGGGVSCAGLKVAPQCSSCTPPVEIHGFLNTPA